MKEYTMRTLLILLLIAVPVAATTVTITTTDVAETRLNGAQGTYNYGGTTYLPAGIADLSAVPSGYVVKFDLSDITGTVDVSAAVCSLHHYSGAIDTNTAYCFRILTSWTEGVENGATVTSGHPGATWQYATDFYAGEGTDSAWQSGANFGASDYVATPVDTTEDIDGDGWFVFDGPQFAAMIENMINGTYPVASFAVGIVGTGDRFIDTEDYSAGSGPRLVITYTEGEAPPSSSNVIRKGTVRKGTIR